MSSSESNELAGKMQQLDCRIDNLESIILTQQLELTALRKQLQSFQPPARQPVPIDIASRVGLSTVSELIRQLQNLQEQHGDLPVYSADHSLIDWVWLHDPAAEENMESRLPLCLMLG